MEIRLARAEDIETIWSLLMASNLPAADVTKTSHITFFVAEEDTRVIAGCIGLQEHDDVGSLRSLAVRPDARDAGIGRALVVAVEEAAALRRMERLYLLTTTANGFFARYGYRAVERIEAPDAIRGTTQFAELCPASATFMVKLL
jgi:amino-acid N-acetyltransferase